MKLFFAFALLALASAQTLFLHIQLKNASAAIDADHLSSLSQTLPYLIASAVPSKFQQYVQYIQDISTNTDYNATSKIATVNVYFPNVPVQLNALLKAQIELLQTPLSGSLSAILPSYLNCSVGCEFESINVRSTAPGFSPPQIPPTSAPPVRRIVGLKMLVSGANKTVDDGVVKSFQVILPGLLETQLSKIKELPENSKTVLIDFVKKVDITQKLVPKLGLVVYASFPSIPASYIDMYAPLFDKYVVKNPQVHEFLADYLPRFLGCTTTCKLEAFKLLDDVAPASLVPTKQPTPLKPVAPSSVPTKEPTKKNYSKTYPTTYPTTHLTTYQKTHLQTYGVTHLTTYQKTHLQTYGVTHLRSYGVTFCITY